MSEDAETGADAALSILKLAAESVEKQVLNPKREVHIILSSEEPGKLRMDTETFGYAPDDPVDGMLMVGIGLVQILTRPQYAMLREMIHSTIALIAEEYSSDTTVEEEAISGEVDDNRESDKN